MPDGKSFTETVNIPKWLWGLLTVATMAAIHHSVMLHVTASEVDGLKGSYHRNTDVLSTIRDEQLRRTNLVDSLNSLKTECSRITETLNQVRDDVLLLKARNENAHPK
jgi:septal ring factor EnvC (AmiA/AmiB activator)